MLSSRSECLEWFPVIPYYPMIVLFQKTVELQILVLLYGTCIILDWNFCGIIVWILSAICKRMCCGCHYFKKLLPIFVSVYHLYSQRSLPLEDRGRMKIFPWNCFQTFIKNFSTVKCCLIVVVIHLSILCCAITVCTLDRNKHPGDTRCNSSRCCWSRMQ